MKRIVAVVLAGTVAVALIGLGLAWARPDLMPAWAQLRGVAPGGASADSGLFCAEHGVPERFCTLCHEELKTSLLLCPEHGDIPEDICTLCHPEVREKHNIEMCPEGHGLPKHFCVECGTGPSASAAQPDDGWCATHNKPEPLCDACAQDPRPIGPAGRGDGTRTRACRRPLPVVRLASVKLARQVGIESAPVAEETHAHSLTANAEVDYDANRYAEVSPRVGGFLREVRADLGQDVRPGEVLAVVDSAEVGAAKTQYLSAQAVAGLAQATSDRTRSLAKTGALPAKQELEALTALNQAQATVMDAAQKLRNLGFVDADLARILQSRDTDSLLNVVAPIGGTVVVRHAVRGEAVQATTPLFAVADTSGMWLWIDVYESDIAKIEPGQSIAFTISGTGPEGDGDAVAGRVTWIGTEVSRMTRTTRVRAELPNTRGRLRANQFGQALIQVGAAHRVVVVPRAAVQRKDQADLVFIPGEEGVYRPQRILTRVTDRPDVMEVTWGLEPGQRVVTRGAFLLKTEIMKGAIGAGCCE